MARLSVSAPALLTAPGALESTVAGRQLSVEVLDRRGRFVARSLALGAKLLPDTQVAADALRRGRGGFADVSLGSDPVRLYAAPLPDDGGPAAGGAVLVASSTTDIDQTLHRLDLLLLLSGLLAAGVGGAAAAVLTRRGLGPLARMSAAAAEIERTGDASRRLPDPHAAGEVAELTRTLNQMLAALDAARLRERRFLADASHELRTPVTSLAGNVEFVARHGVNPEVLADLQLDTQRLQSLVGDLLALERESAGPPPDRDVRLDLLVTEAVAGRTAVRVSACEPVTVRGEPDALRRALDNLLDNAEVHGPRGERSRSRSRWPAHRGAGRARRGPRPGSGRPRARLRALLARPRRGGPPRLRAGPGHRASDGAAPRRSCDGGRLDGRDRAAGRGRGVGACGALTLVRLSPCGAARRLLPHRGETAGVGVDAVMHGVDAQLRPPPLGVGNGAATSPVW